MTDYPNNIPAKLEIIKASEITPKEVRWLWYPYIPFGKVTLLQGDPGDGKSKLMLSLAALLSKGAPLPFADEDESGEPMTIIYQTTEDDADDTVVPRFNSAGGDGDRLIFIKEDEKSLTFGDDRIREAVEKYNAKLLILDPMSSYMNLLTKSARQWQRLREWDRKPSPARLPFPRTIISSSRHLQRKVSQAAVKSKI